MYLLDTDTCIYILRGNARVLDVVQRNREERIGVSLMSLYELERGVLKATQWKERKRLSLDNLKKEFSIIPFDEAGIQASARVRASLEIVGSPIGSIDYLIAGTALAHDLTFVTGNENEFKRVEGLRIENWIM